MFVRELSQNNNVIKSSIILDNCHPSTVTLAITTSDCSNPELTYVNLSRDKLRDFLVDLLVDLENSRHSYGDIYV